MLEKEKLWHLSAVCSQKLYYMRAEAKNAASAGVKW